MASQQTKQLLARIERDLNRVRLGCAEDYLKPASKSSYASDPEFTRHVRGKSTPRIMSTKVGIRAFTR